MEEFKFGHGLDYGNSAISVRRSPARRVVQFEPSTDSIRAVPGRQIVQIQVFWPKITNSDRGKVTVTSMQ